MEEMKVELVSIIDPSDMQIVSYSQTQAELAREKLLERRRKTAERVRRCRERKKFQKQIMSASSSSVDQWQTSQRAVRRALGMYYDSEPTEMSSSSTVPQTKPQISETIDITEDEEEAIENTTIMALAQQRGKEKDPLELVKVNVWAEESSRTVTQTGRIEEIVVGLEESCSAPILGPNIHGTCYCERKTNGMSWSTLSFKDDYADSTFNGAGHGENIFRRKCQGSNCRGCVVEIISPVQRFEIPIPDKDFLRCASNYGTKLAVLNIAGQTGLPKATFNFLNSLSAGELKITCQQFTRMWRTILLRRVQDVHCRSTGVRGPNMIALSAGILVPAPLRDLLDSIGRFHSKAIGVIHLTTAPEKEALSPEEDWWKVDSEVTSQWCNAMSMLQNKFVMKRMPSSTDYDGRPLMMTQVEVTPVEGMAIEGIQQHMVRCMAKTNEIGLTDGYVHMVNDPLYNPSIYSFEECHLIVSSQVSQLSLRIDYLKSYVINDEV